MKGLWQVALVAALVAVPALGQDSTSKPPFGAAIGDAVYAWDTTEQLNTFVVDLEPVMSTLGYQFGVAPLVKSSKRSDEFLSSLINAQGASNSLLVDVGFPIEVGNSYGYWDAPGYGVNNNAGLNYVPATISTVGWTGNQFGVAFSEFGDGSFNLDTGGIIGAVVNYVPDEPHRLYVARICAAIDSHDNQDEGNTGAFNMGAVDSDGNVHFRGDNFLSSGPDPLSGQYYFRVRMLDRNYAITNYINLLGPTDPGATDTVLDFALTDPTYSTPSIIPEQVAGRPVLISSNYTSEYVYEQTPAPAPLAETILHLAPEAVDHRGAVGFSHLLTSVVDSVGTAGILGKDALGSTLVLNLWDVDANGNVLNKYGLVAPEPLDSTHGLPAGTSMTDIWFDHYGSQTAYQGGNGPVAVGKDLAGNGLAAGVVFQAENWVLSSYTNPFNAILVGRFDPTDPAGVAWKVAGYVMSTDPLDLTVWEGTPLYNTDGDQIGRLAPLFKLTGGDPVAGTGTLGPSLTAPAFDGLGNVYFVAPCQFYVGEDVFYASALVRAIYDRSDFSYKLEVLFTRAFLDYDAGGAVLFGSILHGQNSDTNYVISYMEIADSNSIGSGAFWSGNSLQSDTPLDRGTPDGVAVSASIIYDVGPNGTPDGKFDGTLGVDEEYNVMLYVSPPACIRGDTNCDGAINTFDIDAFVIALTTGQLAWEGAYDCDFLCANDINGDGVVNTFDIDPFVALLTGK